MSATKPQPPLLALGSLKGYTLNTRNGDIGRVRDLLFTDDNWHIPYVVVATPPLIGREVLVFTSALGEPDPTREAIPADLNQDQVKNSPGVEWNRPVSRQSMATMHQFYGWPPMTFGTIPTRAPGDSDERQGDIHLRSFNEVQGYAIRATDGEIGHVEELIGEVGPLWLTRYVVVDTRNWLPGGRKVLLLPDSIKRIAWDERTVHVDLNRSTVRESPEFDPSRPVNREVQETFYDYYGRPAER